jgi:hypothetical protein
MFRTFWILTIAWLLSSCASVMGLDSDPSRAVETPDYRVGDRWVYHVSDGYRLPVEWEETHEVTAIENGQITVRVSRVGDNINDSRIEIWPAPGLVSQGAIMNDETRQFAPPWQRFRFPMRAGESWHKWLHADRGDKRGGNPDVRTQTIGWEKIASPLGETDALMMFVYFVLDDDEFWRWPTRGTYKIWYAPAVNNIVYAENYAWFVEKTDRESMFEIPVFNATVHLLSYERGVQGSEVK